MDAPPGARGWRRFAGARWPWMVALLALACGYYGSYVQYGIGFRDEGQTVALGAQRLLNGEVPLKQVVLSYNVLWFYPVVGLFKVFGVSYVLLRAWCLALSTLTAVLGFLLVEKTTRRPWIAFLVAVVLVLIPGSPFKNYIPLLAVANTLCLLHLALVPAESRAVLIKTLVGGVVLGLSFLIRIDIAILFAVIWAGLLLARMLTGNQPWRSRVLLWPAGFAVLAGAVLAVHWPVWRDAQRRGFDRELAAEYYEKWRMLTLPVERLLHHPPRRALQPAHAGVHAQTPRRAALAAPDDTTAEPAADKGILQRAGIKDLDRAGQNVGAVFLFLAYAPVLSVLVLVTWGLVTMIRGLRWRDSEEQQRGLGVLVLMGGALTTFPQFFFFRPDIPHLSEFMPGFLASTAAASGLLWARTKTWKNWRTLLTAFLLVHVAVYVFRVLPDRWAGTYAVRNKRTKFFAAENGVRVYVSSRELTGLTAIQQLLRTYAPKPNDYVVCYPYSPGINLLANRPTYERNVYVDNATRTTRWDAEAIARIEKFQPAVIVLSDWDINGTKASRFSVWAVKAKTWIQTHYTYQGSYIAGSDAFEIYTRTPAPPL
ncbi:MAG: hypothetical protein QOE70_2784 [Chthoniobacter sp.]|nr:hypothetical protein [Chthoniobacter sp.]